MSELFTQNYSDKPLFHTDTDISESLHNQVDEASNGEELLDNTEKQAESLLSNDDYVSETKDVISDDSEDVAESLSPPADGNRKYITGTNTPRASRSNAYYELLCNQQTNGHRSPAMRGTTAAAHGITSASGLVSYQEDFATDAAQDLGVHGAAAELIMQETFIGTAAEDVGILGSYAVKGVKDVQDGTRTAEEVLHTGGDVLRMELGASAVHVGSAGARTALHYAETFSTSADDFAARAPTASQNIHLPHRPVHRFYSVHPASFPLRFLLCKKFFKEIPCVFIGQHIALRAAAVQRRHLAGVEIFLIVSGKFRCLGFKQDIATASAVNRKLDSKGNHHFANAVVFPLGSQCWVSIMKTKKDLSLCHII